MPKITSVTVTHEAAITANMGDFESYRSGVTLTETWDVTDLDTEAAENLVEERRLVLHEQVDGIVEEEYTSNSNNAKKG